LLSRSASQIGIPAGRKVPDFLSNQTTIRSFSQSIQILVFFESKRVVIISTTEGVDKPIKYPDMFRTSDICIINKIDLLPYLNIDISKLKECALKVNPNLKFYEVSATAGEGMNMWYKWLK
jgi:Ni2+-binding GTPase involved in maturation of urease and hydrogenase